MCKIIYKVEKELHLQKDLKGNKKNHSNIFNNSKLFVIALKNQKLVKIKIY